MKDPNRTKDRRPPGGGVAEEDGCPTPYHLQFPLSSSAVLPATSFAKTELPSSCAQLHDIVKLLPYLFLSLAEFRKGWSTPAPYTTWPPGRIPILPGLSEELTN